MSASVYYIVLFILLRYLSAVKMALVDIPEQTLAGPITLTLLCRHVYKYPSYIRQRISVELPSHVEYNHHLQSID